MSNTYRLLAVALVTTLSGGCASMSADECVLGDWHAIGYEDGAQGFTVDRLGVYRKSCAKHGVTPDFVSYRQGRAEGLREYCQPSRGFNLGASGGIYHGICAADQEPFFLDAYRQGQHLHALRSNVSEIDASIASREAELDGKKQAIRDTQAALIDSATPAEDRILLLADLKSLSEDAGRLEAEIDRLLEERAGHAQELASYQDVLAANGY